MNPFTHIPFITGKQLHEYAPEYRDVFEEALLYPVTFKQGTKYQVMKRSKYYIVELPDEVYQSLPEYEYMVE